MNEKNLSMKLKVIFEKNCELLQISFPKFEIVDSSLLPSPTMRAAIEWNGVSSEKMRLVINEKFVDLFQKEPVQAWLTISHELRHVWQIENGGIFARKKILSADIVEYNKLDEEVDAWAWTVFIMQRELGLRPDFEPLFGKDLTEAIVARAKEIKKEVNK